jgi:anionic cell wall polymer biosynthesis LytR-Cps2A-Psr (LCP) family protein
MEKYIEIYKELKPMFYTDMTLNQIASLGCFFKKLDSEAIDSSLIDGDFMNLNGISYWNPNIQHKDAMVDKIFLAKPN